MVFFLIDQTFLKKNKIDTHIFSIALEIILILSIQGLAFTLQKLTFCNVSIQY